MNRTVRWLVILGFLAVSSQAGANERKTGAPATPPATPTPPARESTPPPPARPAPVRRPVVVATPQPAKPPLIIFRREPRDIDRKLSASPRGNITIVNAAGSVVVTGWSQNEVQVTGTLGGGVKKMVFTRDGDEVNLQVVPRPNYPLGDDSELQVHVPAGSRVDLKTFSATIEVDGITGTIDMESMNGRIDVSGAPRLVHAECVSCDMEIDATTEVVRAENMTGTINVSNAKGLVELSTVSGAIELEADKAEEITLTAVSGSINFRGNPGRNGSLVFQTHSGPIELSFPGNLSADFDIVSYMGTIESELGNARPQAQRAGTAREAHFSTGSGGTRIKIETFSGPINVHKE